MTTMNNTASSERDLEDPLHARVREHYAAAARRVTATSDTGEGTPRSDTCCDDSSGAHSCCGPVLLEVEPGLGASLYSQEEREALPDAAVAAALGCGNPTAVAQLGPGDRVLDLGSGGGIDVLLTARRVGPTGVAYGVDMTEEMLHLARSNAARAGVTNVEFLLGRIEDIPLPDASVDVVISNCVVNLSPDKPAVLAQARRVLAPGGRLGITDIVADEGLTPEERAERGSWAGCMAGALTVAEYERLLAEAGFQEIHVEITHEVAPGMHSAMIKATTPVG